jgi:hypothetical protein
MLIQASLEAIPPSSGTVALEQTSQAPNQILAPIDLPLSGFVITRQRCSLRPVSLVSCHDHGPTDVPDSLLIKHPPRTTCILALCPSIRQLQGKRGNMVVNADMLHIESDCTQAAQWFTTTFSPAVDVGHVWSVRGT